MVSPRSLRALVRDLRQLEATGFGSDAVYACLGAGRLDLDSLTPYLHFSVHQYTRNLIHRTDCFELLAICWDIGQASPIHDHENERCWARVAQGRLEFTNYQMAADQPLCLEQAGSTVTGSANWVDALPGIHRVNNSPSFGERAVSLHLYSRPFAQCTVYDADTGVRQIRQLRYDTVPAAPPSSGFLAGGASPRSVRDGRSR